MYVCMCVHVCTCEPGLYSGVAAARRGRQALGSVRVEAGREGGTACASVV